MANKFDKLFELYKSLPGVSKKMAERLVVYTIENKMYIKNTLESIIKESSNLEKDQKTGLLLKKDEIANENKNKDILLVVDSNKDYFNLVERTNTNDSTFILDMEKKDFQNIKKINILIERLFIIVKEYNTKEILFLLSPSIETELIIRVIKEEILKTNLKDKVNLTRISIGMPFGGSVEFSDERTIKEAIKRREKI